MCSCVANFIPVVYIITVYNNSITIFEPPIPNITSCYYVSESRIIVAAFVLLVVFEFEILFLTLYRSIKHHRSLASNSHLLNILIQHNILYFICGFVCSLLVMLFVGLLPFMYSDLITNVQVTVHALLITRMHLELWKSDRPQEIDLDDITLDTFHQATRRHDEDSRGNVDFEPRLQ
ncbi:hypothetical protein BDR05DRAFT_591964 [Suillus weaverae]|nr:hypothetical protein BDR05DRAFT_591964 [Suillus weaverae]